MRKYCNDNSICDICGKPRIVPGHIGRIEHPACSKKRQELYAEKKRKKAKATLNTREIEFLASFNK